MNTTVKQQIFDKICEYESIIIFRHTRPDGDAVGSTKGLREIIRESFPEKKVYVINGDSADYLAFLGDEDSDLSDEIYKSALGIIIDTATLERISNPKYAFCREIIKIDHHIEVEPYGNISWVEEKRSSASEMIADFYRTFSDRLKINADGAKYIYTGMITDSGRFRFSSTSGETLRLAGMLLDFGIDLDTLHANLYLHEFNSLKFQAYVYDKMQITENGVAYLHVTKEMQEQFSLSYEDAGAAVSYMDSIKNSLIWIAFIDNDDGSIRVRLRSRFVTINALAERYSGGGHACASGATVYSHAEMNMLVNGADEILKAYKNENVGWM